MQVCNITFKISNKKIKKSTKNLNYKSTGRFRSHDWNKRWTKQQQALKKNFKK